MVAACERSCTTARPKSSLVTPYGEIADVLPPAALLQILRGVAIGLELSDAVPRRVRRVALEPPATERRVLLDALAALVRQWTTSPRRAFFGNVFLWPAH